MKTLMRIVLGLSIVIQVGLSGFAQSGGMISTVAGNGKQGFGGDGGAATSAILNQPEGLAVDAAGNLYIADTTNSRIRIVTTDGIIYTVAGSGTREFVGIGDGGQATSATLNGPAGIALDSAGNLYIADSGNRRIRKVTPDGIISTVAGNGGAFGNGGVLGPSGDGGRATSAALAFTERVAVDRLGNLFFSEFGGFGPPFRVRKVTPDGVISTVLPLMVAGGLAVDSKGDLYIADSFNNRVCKMTPEGVISTVVGTASLGFSGDGGPATSAKLNSPTGLAFDWAGSLFIADFSNNRIRKVTPDGVISTVAGNGTAGFAGDGGPATSAQLNNPIALAVDPLGNFFFVDSGNNRIRRVQSANPLQMEEVFVPIVLTAGGMNGSFYTSEMTLTNRGSRNVTVNFTYTASFGSGSGIATDTLAPGQQKIVPDAISYLRNLGIPIPSSGGQCGTLRITFSSLVSFSDVGVTVRTTTVVPEGRAGLAYAGVPPSMALTGPAYICGLRQNETDRSNVAVQNVGTAEDGDITLRLTVYSGSVDTRTSKVLPDLVVSPGGFVQISGILSSNGLSLENGYARVERVSGTAPYYAYGVINDQANSDGSFIPPIPENTMAGKTRMTLPVVVETGNYSTELVVTNWSATKKTLTCRFVSDNVETSEETASFTIEINPFQQLIQPALVQWLRDSKVAGIGSQGPVYAGPLLISTASGDLSGVMMAARTSSSGARGRYGVFYTAISEGQSSSQEAWLYGLQQNMENRTSLALVNTGEMDNTGDTFNLELYDGETGQLATTITGVSLPARGWTQFNMILAQYAPHVQQGYAHVVQTGGTNPFIAYAVINDGAHPGERSGDGTFIASTP